MANPTEKGPNGFPSWEAWLRSCRRTAPSLYVSEHQKYLDHLRATEPQMPVPPKGFSTCFSWIMWLREHDHRKHAKVLAMYQAAKAFQKNKRDTAREERNERNGVNEAMKKGLRLLRKQAKKLQADSLEAAKAAKKKS